MVAYRWSLHRIGPLAIAAALLPVLVIGIDTISTSNSDNSIGTGTSTSTSLIPSNSAASFTASTSTFTSTSDFTSTSVSVSVFTSISTSFITSSTYPGSSSSSFNTASSSTVSSPTNGQVTTSSSSGAAITSPLPTSSAVASSGTITSCTSYNIFQFVDPALFSMPLTEIIALLSTKIVQLQQLSQTLVRIQAQPSSLISNPAAVQDYYTSLYNEEYNDLVLLFGSKAFPFFYAYPFLGQPCLFLTCSRQYYEISSAFVLAHPSTTFDPLNFVGQPPCCQQCSIVGQAVELSYWPTPAPQPPASTLVDEANHTFISPSVYAVFTGLSAINRCGKVGATYALESITFDPSELSTSSIVTDPNAPLGNWTAINFANFGPQCICTANCEFDPILGRTLANICTPQLSIPVKVSALDPAWSACAADFGGVFDPPVALSIAGGLSIPKPTSAQPTTEDGHTIPPTSLSAIPVNTPTPTAPNPTPPLSDTPPVPVIASSPAPANPQPTVPNPTTPPSDTINTPPIPVIVSPPSPVSPQLTAASLAPSAPIVVVVASTAQVLTINGQPITANTQGDFVIGTQTLTPGGTAITVSGTPISLASSATVIVVGGTTISLATSVTDIPLGDSSTVLRSIVILTATNNGGAAATGTAAGTPPASIPISYTAAASKDVEVLATRAKLVALLLFLFVVWL